MDKYSGHAYQFATTQPCLILQSIKERRKDEIKGCWISILVAIRTCQSLISMHIV